MIRACSIMVLIVCTIPVALAQTPTQPDSSSPSVTKNWSFELTGDYYSIPQDTDYASATFSADRKKLHLETRYNYENLKTGSCWVGYNFSVGDKLTLDVTPMIGGVFGRTTGIAPGYEVSLSYKKFLLTTDGEYVFDTKNAGGNFFYSWMEFSYSPAEWVRFGLVSQKTKAYQTGLDIQRGFLVGFMDKNLEFDSYVFNAGWTDPTVVIQVVVSF